MCDAVGRLGNAPPLWSSLRVRRVRETEIKQVPDIIDLRRILEGDFLGFEIGHFARCEKIVNFLSSGELRSL